MPRRRSRRRTKTNAADTNASDVAQPLGVEDLSPRARRLVDSGVIDLDSIAGSGENGKVTSGDILHAARIMEMEQSVARIEQASNAARDFDRPPTPPDAAVAGELTEVAESVTQVEPAISGTSSAAQVGGQPISVAHNPWDAYNGSSEGLSESAMPGAEQSWGEAEANIAAIAEEAAAQGNGTEASLDPSESDEVLGIEALSDADSAGQAETDADAAAPMAVDEPVVEDVTAEERHLVDDAAGTDAVAIDAAADPDAAADTVVGALEKESVADLVAAANEAIATTTADQIPPPADPPVAEDLTTEHSDVIEAAVNEPLAMPSQGEEMMDFGTLELVDPESVWAEGAEDFAPWFLAHSRQLGDVLGLEAGLSDARQFTTKSATGVVGSDDNGEEVVVVSSKSARADDADLGRALGMAASSGAASVALVSAAIDEDQLKALAWLNNQTRSGVKWYGIEMRVVRIADSPAAMLFDLVASPSEQQ